MWTEKRSTSMTTPWRATILLITAGLVLSLLMIGTVDPASAQPKDVELTCEVGTLLVDQCVEEVPPSSPGEEVCPTSATVFSSDGDCYTLVPKPADTCPTGAMSNDGDSFCLQPVATVDQLVADGPACPGPSELRNDLGGVCAQLVPASITDPVCPQLARGAAGACYEIVEPGDAQQLGCPSGSAIDDYELCRRPVSDLPTSLNCPDAAATLVGNECVWTLPAGDGCSNASAIIGCQPTDLICPDGFMTDSGLPGLCTRSEPASQHPATCPDGARGTAGDCYILVAPGPRVGLCTTGALVGSVCLILGNPPVTSGSGAPQCEAGFGSLNGDCVRYEPTTLPPVHCPAGSAKDAQGDCRKPVEDAVGDYYCEDASAALQGNVCLFVADPITGHVGPCPDEYDFDGQELCVRTQSAIPSGPPCPSGTLGTAGDCFVFVGLPTPESTCQRGILVGPQLCRQPVADLEGRPYCEDPTAELRGAQCLVIADGFDGQPSTYCPTGFVPNDSLGGLCARFEPASQQPPRCPEGSRGEVGACYILVATGPGPMTCEQGTLTGSNCVIVGNPPVAGPGSCPISATVLEDGDLCYTLVPSAGGICNAPLLTEPSNAEVCRRQADLRPGAKMCEPGYGIVDGQCITYVSPTRGAPSCPAGTVAKDTISGCRRPIDDAAGPRFCLDPAAALNGSSCVFVADFIVGCNPATDACVGERDVQVCPVNGNIVEPGDECAAVVHRVKAACPADTTTDAATTSCRKPVPLVQSPASCPAEFGLDGTRCIRVSSARGISVFDCRSVDTATCRTIVQSAQDAVPAAELVAGRATTLKYFGCADGVTTFQVASGTTIVAAGQLTEPSPGVYSGVYEVSSSGSYMLEVQTECPDGSANKVTDMLVFIDPSGFVLDCEGDIISGAKVTLSRSSNATGTLSVVADGDTTIMDPSINVSNPSLTDADGRYRWGVAPGFYQVTAAVPGQPTVSSAILEVPPARTDVDLVFPGLNCATTEPSAATTEPSAAPTAEPTTEPTAVPTAESTTEQSVTRAQLQTGPIYEGADASTLSPVVPAATADTVTTTSLALTGNETTKSLVSALSLMGLGLFLLGASRRRRR